jgi:hypothetical protein
MKLNEIKIKARTGFSPYPNEHGRYMLNGSSSVQFTGTVLPKDSDQGSWRFVDGNFQQTIDGPFKIAVTKAVAAHKRAKESSFSNTLKVGK